MKIKKRTLSWIGYFLAHIVLLLLLIFGLDVEPMFAAIAIYLLILFRVGCPEDTRYWHRRQP